MLKIRLKRTGRRNNPSFRIIVTESTRGPKSGRAIDVIGFYNAKEGEKRIDGEKASTWLSKGAQPSGTVHNMLVDEGVISGKKVNVLPKKSPIVKEQAEEEKPAASAEPEEPEDVQPSESSGGDETPEDSLPESIEDTPADEASTEGQSKSQDAESDETDAEKEE